MPTDTLPEAVRGPLVGEAIIDGEPRIVVNGGKKDNFSAGSQKVRIFNPLTGTHADATDYPGETYQGDGTLPQGRAWQNVGRFANGDLLFIGNQNGVGGAGINACWRFVIADGTWTRLADITDSAGFFGFGRCNGSFIAFCTLNGTGSNTYQWDPNSDTWSAIFPSSDPVGTTHTLGAGCELGDCTPLIVRLFINEGDQTYTLLASTWDGAAWVDEPIDGPISYAAENGAPGAPQCVQLGGQKALVTITHGDLGAGHPVTAYRRASDGTWSAAAAPSNRAYFSLAGSYSGEAFAVGGELHFGLTDSIQRYDADGNAWAEFDVLPAPMEGVTAIVSGSKLYCFGGATAIDDFVDTVAIYDVAATSLLSCCVVPHHDVLVFDLRNPCGPGGADSLGQWYSWRPTGETPEAACLHGGVHHYLDEDGTVRYEVDGQEFDDVNQAILTAVETAPISFAQLEGAERLYWLQVDGHGAGDCTVRLTARTVTDDRDNPTVWTEDVAVTAATAALEGRLTPKGTSVAVRVEEVASDNLTAGHKLRAFGFEVGISGRMRRLNASKRVPG